MSARDALMRFSKKQLSTNCKPIRKKNGKPEQITVKECMAWFHEHGFLMDIIESRAVFSASAGRYLRGQTVAGMVDSVGCTPTGIGCFVEFKAKGKISTLKEHQKEFIRQKILKGCFAVVTDCKDDLAQKYHQWNLIQEHDKDSSVGYLLSVLPKCSSDNSELFGT